MLSGVSNYSEDKAYLIYEKFIFDGFRGIRVYLVKLVVL